MKASVCAVAAMIMILGSCDVFGLGPEAEAGGPSPVLDVSPSPPAVSGDQSRVVVSGSISGEAVSFTWDFADLGSAGGVNTNGAMGSQIGSGNADGTVSVWLTSDFDTTVDGDSTDEQSASDWYLRFTLGGVTLDRTIYNHKDTFAIPTRAYSQITLYKGPSPSARYRNREHSDVLSQTAQTVAVLSGAPDYNAAADRLRIAGSLRSEWNEGSDYVQADFSVLIGGPDDRNASTNRNSLSFVFE